MDNWKKEITIDLLTGKLSYAEIAPHDAGISMREHNRLELSIRLPYREYEESEILTWFADQFASEIKTICDGLTEEWDGSNYVGRYATKQQYRAALDAEHMIVDWLGDHADSLPGYEIWDAADWYLGELSREEIADELGITETTTDTEISEIAQIAAKTAEQEHGVKLTDTAGLVEHVRDYLAECAEVAS